MKPVDPLAREIAALLTRFNWGEEYPLALVLVLARPEATGRFKTWLVTNLASREAAEQIASTAFDDEDVIDVQTDPLEPLEN